MVNWIGALLGRSAPLRLYVLLRTVLKSKFVQKII